MNQLVQGLLTKFVEDQAFVGLSQSEAFERLAVWCILARALPTGSSIDDLMAGNETVGIDALAIVANEELILDEQDAEDVTSGGHTVDVDFTFVQAKTSEKFERPDILNFGESVVDFFSTTPGLVTSKFIQERRPAKDTLYAKSPLFRNRRPTARLAYVTSGSVPDDPNINSAVNAVVAKLQATSLFEEVQFELLGAAEIHRSFSQIETGKRLPAPRHQGIVVPGRPRRSRTGRRMNGGYVTWQPAWACPRSPGLLGPPRLGRRLPAPRMKRIVVGPTPPKSNACSSLQICTRPHDGQHVRRPWLKNQEAKIKKPA